MGNSTDEVWKIDDDLEEMDIFELVRYDGTGATYTAYTREAAVLLCLILNKHERTK